MNELDEAWSEMLAGAIENARASGRGDVADFLALKRSNNALRQTAVDWLFNSFVEIASEANRWRGGNRGAYSRPELDTMYRQYITTIDPAARERVLVDLLKFTSEDDDIQFKAGFVYLPKVNPKHVAWRTYQYIGNGWWAWREEG